MKLKNAHNHIIEQVPIDYYQKGVKNNLFQRVWHTRKLSAVLSYLDKDSHDILDVGCASGWFLSQVHKKFPKSRCVGVDIYKEAIRFAKKKYSKIFFYHGDAHQLPFLSRSFDTVICTEVLEHIDNPEKAILEIKRVLKNNGRLVIELDSGSILFSIVWFLWGFSRGSVWHDSHLHSFNTRKLEKLLKRSGFRIDHKRQFNLGMAMVFAARKTK